MYSTCFIDRSDVDGNNQKSHNSSLKLAFGEKKRNMHESSATTIGIAWPLVEVANPTLKSTNMAQPDKLLSDWLASLAGQRIQTDPGQP